MSFITDAWEWMKTHLPIRSPLEDLEIWAKPIEHRPITTRRGRVVYARKRHEFGPQDIIRVFRAVWRSDMYSVGGLFAALVKTNLMIMAYGILTYDKMEFLSGGWINGYIKGILDGIRELLQSAGWTLDEISLAEGGASPGEETTLA